MNSRRNSPRGFGDYLDGFCACCSKKLNSGFEEVVCQDCFKEIDENSVHDIKTIIWVNFCYLMDSKNSKLVVSMLDDHYFKCSCSDSLYTLGDIKKALIHSKECHSLQLPEEIRDVDVQSFDLNELVMSTLYSFFVLEDYDFEQLNRKVGRMLKDAHVA